MAVKVKDSDVYCFADVVVSPDQPHDNTYRQRYQSEDTPIIIDNGSWQCKVGWGSEDTPLLVFRSLMARMRGKRGESDYTLIGNDIANIETLRSTLKNQFDRNVVINFSCQEQMFDHIFTILGLSRESSIHHPIVLTEPPCNPGYCQNAMSELLFECYEVPALTYGIDGLYNLYHSLGGHVTDALVINSGYQTTHVMPVINGRFQADHCKRINVGGFQVSSYLQRLLQLRYPSLQGLITLSRAEELVHNHCYIAEDYIQTLSQKAWPQRTVQLPYVGGSVGQVLDPSEQVEKDQQRRERARQHLLRLSQSKREEKIRKLEDQLEKLIHLQQLAAVADPEEYQLALEEAGFSSLEIVLQEMTSIQEALEVERSRLQTTLHKLMGGEAISTTSSSDQVDPQWIQTLHIRRKELLDQKKSRLQQKQELSKRRSAASQDRMRIISKLAEDSSVKSGREQEDTFGMDDEDWNVYRAIHKPGSGGSDSEKEEAELSEINKLLQRYDPSSVDSSSSTTASTHYQLQLGVELIRVPEVLFQPSLIGVDQCGLVDTIELVLNGYPPELQQRLMDCVLICGSNCSFEGIKNRLITELTSIRPFQSSFSVRPAIDKIYGGWKGAALWSRLNPIDKKWISRAQYHELGSDYWIEHEASNRCSTRIT